ncbi:hypothetical protein ABE426_08800 [Sphingobacterium faecium]|uniref:hypothetical protein n=1 Tax=Sphingobacterium faecium TaxID=34087 RepID=UPI00320A7149
MAIDIIIIFIILILGFKFPLLIKFNKKNYNQLKWLWLYHLLFGFIYYYYVSAQGGSDSLKYWDEAKDLTGDMALQLLFEKHGTSIMYVLNYIPSNLMNLSFFTGTILYCFIGYMGFVYFYKIAFDLIPYNYKMGPIYLFPSIFYLPNLHFWSSAIGKDTLLFFCVGLFAYSLMKLDKRIIHVLFSLLLAYLVRPHIALFLLLSFSMAYLMNNKIASYKRIILFGLMLAGGVVMLPSVLEYTKIEELSVQSYESFSETKVKNLSRAHTGSSVDVSSYPLPLKIFTFLYRPTFIDIQSVTALLAAIENFLLLILSIIVLCRKPIKTFKAAPLIIKGLVFFLMIGTVAFSMSLGNLGIMLRMRNMFLPGMLIFILWSMSCHYIKKNRLNLK